MTLFSFIKVSLDKSSDLTSVKERSELLECKCVHFGTYVTLVWFYQNPVRMWKKVNVHVIKNYPTLGQAENS